MILERPAVSDSGSRVKLGKLSKRKEEEENFFLFVNSASSFVAYYNNSTAFFCNTLKECFRFLFSSYSSSQPRSRIR